MVLETCTGMK